MADDQPTSRNPTRRRVLQTASLLSPLVVAPTATARTGSRTRPSVTADEPLAVEDDGDVVEISTDDLTVRVRRDPFGVAFEQPAGGAPTGLGFGDDTGRPGANDEPHHDADADPPALRKYGTFGFAIGERQAANTPMESWGVPVAVEEWLHATRAISRSGTTFEVATEDPSRTATVAFEPGADGSITVRAGPDDETRVVKTGWSFARADGERFLGFGERSDGVDQTGTEVENWAEEGPYSAGALKPATDPTLGERWQGGPVGGTNYPIPWFASSEGYGFLLDSTYYNRFYLASDRDDAWHVETWEPSFEATVYPGPTPAEALRRFSADVGRQPEPAPWFFGPWFQAAGPDEFREALTRKWREWDVPVTVRETSIHYLPCADHAGERDFHRARTRRDHERGYKVTAYVNSFVCEDHPNGAFDEGDSAGYFLETPTGDTYPVPYFAYVDEEHRYHGVVDFTDPDAASWWRGLIQPVVDDGYDGWMEDFGEYVPPNSRAADGSTGFELHNRYPTLYHRASHRHTWPLRGRDFAQFVRAGYTRTARYARIVWGGDPNQDYSAADGLKAAISQGQSMGLSGVAYWRSDLGGFVGVFNEERADEELFTRWFQYGAFNGLMAPRARGYPRPGDDSERAQPWHEDVRPTWRKFCKLRTQLFPYVWDAAREYLETGLPIIRHLALHYPDDPEVHAADAEYQFLFGRDLLVAPVVTEGARERTVYLPEGEWVDFWDAVDYDEETGAFRRSGGPVERRDGGRYVTVDAPLDEIPLFVRAGTRVELLPPDVDTLADVGDGEDLVHLADVEERRTLAFPGGGDATGR